MIQINQIKKKNTGVFLNSKSGYALATALIVAAVLSIILMSLLAIAMGIYRQVRQNLPKNQAYYTAVSGLDIIVGVLEGDEDHEERENIHRQLQNGGITINFSHPVNGKDHDSEILGECAITASYDMNGLLVIESKSETKFPTGWYSISASMEKGQIWHLVWERFKNNFEDYFDSIDANEYIWHIKDTDAIEEGESETKPEEEEGVEVSEVILEELFIIIEYGTEIGFEDLNWLWGKYETVYLFIEKGENGEEMFYIEDIKQRLDYVDLTDSCSGTAFLIFKGDRTTPTEDKYDIYDIIGRFCSHFGNFQEELYELFDESFKYVTFENRGYTR